MLVIIYILESLLLILIKSINKYNFKCYLVTLIYLVLVNMRQ